MSVFWIVVLFIVAFIETVSIFTNSVSDIEKAVKEDVQEERNARTRYKKTSDDTSYRGCLGCVLLLISTIVTYIIIPIFTITVIVKNIGYQPFSFINLLVVLITWIWTVIIIYKRPKKPVVDDKNEDDEEDALTKPEDTKETKKPKRITIILLKILTIFQAAYLWYLFLVVINIIK